MGKTVMVILLACLAFTLFSFRNDESEGVDYSKFVSANQYYEITTE